MKLIKRDKRSELETEIDILIGRIRRTEPTDENYSKLIGMVERLNALKGEPREKISPNTILTVFGSILGIVLVIGHEEIGNVISSRALNFVLRGRV